MALLRAAIHVMMMGIACVGAALYDVGDDGRGDLWLV